MCRVGGFMAKYQIKRLGIDFSFIHDEPLVRGSRKKC